MSKFRDDCEFIYSQGFVRGQALRLGILLEDGREAWVNWSYKEGLAPLLSCWQDHRYYSVTWMEYSEERELLGWRTVYAPWYAEYCEANRPQ